MAGPRERADVDLRQLILSAAAPLEGWDLALYVVDFAHRVLFPLPATLSPSEETADHSAGGGVTKGNVPAFGVEVFMEEDVSNSLAGRAFFHLSASDCRACQRSAHLGAHPGGQ